ncbi:hypothetical protein ILYODFUR_006069 [Ilyodon furcidens]|uniref:Secreted protein n=1 Tax=Ilyodon furcidens TaxID=33524 RepID=A0ABV0UGK4_9TELE
MGQINGATLLPFGAICAVFLWESGASSIRTTISVDTSRMECPDNKILTVEYSCVRAGGKNGTCFSSLSFPRAEICSRTVWLNKWLSMSAGSTDSDLFQGYGKVSATTNPPCCVVSTTSQQILDWKL